MSWARWNTASGESLTGYRISSNRFPANDGEGARRYGGRWNHKGTAIVYAGQSVSLCALEILANNSSLPGGCIVIEVDIPDSLPLLKIEVADLPVGWNSPIPIDSTRDFGTNWVLEGATAVLIVPSSIIPSERNFLLNPHHPEFGQIGFGVPNPFRFDSRLK
jgi:RES domain-containing protein